MDRSSTSLDEEAVVSNIVAVSTPTTTRVTNRVRFVMGINPAGMALIKSIDPKVVFNNRFRHVPWGASAMHHARVSDAELHTTEGFCKLYDWLVRDKEKVHLAASLLLGGFPYEIVVDEDSPLVGWCYVLGVNND